MVGVHVLVGIGEAVITFLAVASIIAVRPDLVYGARKVLARRTLEVRSRTTPTRGAAA
jgi:cobalt/nickel transport system permease protein